MRGRLDKTSKRAALSLRIQQACRDLGIRCASPDSIADYALELAKSRPGEPDGTALSVPKRKVLWSKRDARDRKLTPLQFLEKYWQVELNSGDFYQADLSKADHSLFEAIRTFCRSTGRDPKAYLPPPLQRRTKRRAEDVHQQFSSAQHDAAAPHAPARAAYRRAHRKTLHSSDI